jgi:regulator of replication initiation timing
MLIYANNFTLNPSGGPESVIKIVADWISGKENTPIANDLIARKSNDFKTRKGSNIKSCSTISEEGTRRYPFLFSIQYRHSDKKSSGRSWITEVGLRQKEQNSALECSVLLKTEEISTKITNIPLATRPKLVEQLIEFCNPIGTPGNKLKHLNSESADAFLQTIDASTRNYPIVLLSADTQGIYPVDPERIRKQLVGLADTVSINKNEDTYKLGNKLGQRFICFGGAIKIVFPGRDGDYGYFYETKLYSPEEICELKSKEVTIENKVLQTITHRTNLPLSWRHVSLDMVKQANLQHQLNALIENSRANNQTDDLSVYIELLQTADTEITKKDEEIENLRREYQQSEQKATHLNWENRSLKNALGEKQQGEDNQRNNTTESSQVVDFLTALISEDFSVSAAVKVISNVYSERIRFLNSAIKSANDSSAVQPEVAWKCLRLLNKLATEYWQVVTARKGDQDAKTVFGRDVFAPKESDKLSAKGRKQRTFEYKGKQLYMEKHLKIGIKDSKATTIRIHFDWSDQEGIILVGHCGKHLDL